MDFNAIGARHHVWVEAMGWHNKTRLESLALIASEIGEAAGECLNGPTEHFGEELADIVLRTVDLAHSEGIDLSGEVSRIKLDWPYDDLLAGLADAMYHYALWSNTARVLVVGPEYAQHMAGLMVRMQRIAELAHVDLHAEVAKKLAKNAQRGTRGRVI